MKKYLTIDIGGTDIKYGVINDNRELIYNSMTPTNSHLGAKSILNQIKELFINLSKDHKLEGLAISTTGVIDDERSEEHTSELQSRPHLVCRLLLEKKKKYKKTQKPK